MSCPYHGLRFNSDGRCVNIPAEARTEAIPEMLSLKRLQAAERFGIIWASFASEPTLALPDWSLLERDDIVSAEVPAETWEVTAARHAENFNDIAHVSFVHEDTFGTLPPEVPDYTLERLETGLRHHYYEAGNSQLFERHRVRRERPERSGDDRSRFYFDYVFTYPFASSLAVSDPDGRTCYIWDVIQPMALTQSRIYKIVGRNFDLTGPVEGAVKFEQAVNREDRAIMEGILPSALSLHPADGGADQSGPLEHVAYRRALKKFGMGL